MAIELLATCSIPKLATRDGYAGPNARLLIPFADHYWFANGLEYDFPLSTIAQDNSRTLTGLRQTNGYQKECCGCGH